MSGGTVEWSPVQFLQTFRTRATCCLHLYCVKKSMMPMKYREWVPLMTWRGFLQSRSSRRLAESFSPGERDESNRLPRLVKVEGLLLDAIETHSSPSCIECSSESSLITSACIECSSESSLITSAWWTWLWYILNLSFMDEGLRLTYDLNRKSSI